MSTQSIEYLALRAIEQRNYLHESVEKIRLKVEAGRERLRISTQARQHFLAASLLVCLAGIGLGYRIGGKLTRAR